MKKDEGRMKGILCLDILILMSFCCWTTFPDFLLPQKYHVGVGCVGIPFIWIIDWNINSPKTHKIGQKVISQHHPRGLTNWISLHE